MAKSIFEILDDLNTETSVPEIKDKDGKIVRKNYGSVNHTIPRSFLPTAEQFENEEMLLAWFRESGNLHAGLQSAVQKRLIDLRAIFKGVTKDETWTPESGQKKLDKATWTITERPKQGNNIAKVKAQAELTAGINMANAMHLNKVDKSVILASLTPVYGSDVSQTIVDSLID